MEENKKEDEKVTIRHTISAEETFTLAKDVYDLRSLIKNVYNNRAVIARRLNLVSMAASLVFTLLYVAYILCTGLMGKLSLSENITIYCLLGVYAALFLIMFLVAMCGMKAKAKNIKKFNRVLTYFRFIIRLLSLAITIVALAFSTVEGDSSANIAIKILLIILSVICIIIQAIPLFFGGMGKLARWLLSPVKLKYRFSQIALEWYELLVTAGGGQKSVKKVSKKYYDAIGVCLDNYVIPAFRNKYMSSIKSVHILNVAQNAETEDKPIVEGILKNVFSYATECGYIAFDPCKDLNFAGSIDEEEKQSKPVKSRLLGMGKKIGMSMLNKYLDKNTGNDD